MSYLLPVRDTMKADRKAFRQLARDRLVNRAEALGLGRKEELIVRDLLAVDLGLADWGVPIGSPHQPINFVPKRYLGQVMMCIFKVLQLGGKPRATTMTFLGKWGIGRSLTFPLDAIYGEIPLANTIIEHIENAKRAKGGLTVRYPATADPQAVIEPEPLIGAMEGYFTEPIIYDPQDAIEIEVVVREPSDDYLFLGGFVCERFK